MGTIVSFCAGVFLLYWPYVWCWYGKKDPDDYGLRWDFNIKDFMQTLAKHFFAAGFSRCWNGASPPSRRSC